VHVPLEPELIFVLFGKGGGSLASDLDPNLSSLFTYAVTYSLPRFPYSFWILISWGYFALGAGWISHYLFQGSRGGNDTRLHCLGTVEISGMCFAFVFFSYYPLFAPWSVFVLLGFFLVHRFLFGEGMGDTRYSLLPCHGDVAGWVWLRAKPWDAELFSV
jgi:hypothetical protein